MTASHATSILKLICGVVHGDTWHLHTRREDREPVRCSLAGRCSPPRAIVPRQAGSFPVANAARAAIAQVR